MTGAGVETCCGGGGQAAAASASGPPPRGLIVVSAVFLSIFLATFLTLMSLAFCCCRRWRERDAVSGYVDGEGAVVVVAAGESGGGEPFPVEALPRAYAYVVGSSDDGGATAASGVGRECAVCLGAGAGGGDGAAAAGVRARVPRRLHRPVARRSPDVPAVPARA
ncbi:hypothetical protein OsJ_21580 [Oryza sativa Japonica Group]|uniref:Uncharacterized protein n=1 Tax=Oryza sativa subsp. japonica TaxID=39947 RepID=A3BCF3_ORYSJ|nr:hypothetical protein OsJ_21580 [Oryza sativa Japonica Group]